MPSYKVNLKQCAFHSIKGSEIHYLMNTLCWIVTWIAIACRHKTNLPSNCAVTNNGLFLCKSFEERGVQKSVFLGYFKTVKITGKDHYAKCFVKNNEEA